MVRDLVFSCQERMEQEAIIDSLLEINYGGRLRIVRMRAFYQARNEVLESVVS
ncbi:hypothetical protein YC2023_011137 [Brassica napus]